MTGRTPWTLAAAGACAGLIAAAATAAPAAAEGDLRDLIADLYGGVGITLNAGFHQAHFINAAEEELNDLSQVIASDIGSYSFNSSVSSITFDLELGVPVRTEESLGPIFAERASTI